MSVYVFDMDGVLFRMDDPLPYAAETINMLHERGDLIYYLTNNSSKSRLDYVEKLARFDIHTDVAHVITSAWATGQLMIERGEIGKTVYVVGEQGLRHELTAVGMKVVDYSEEQHIDFVIVGWDRAYTYRKMTEAHLSIARGAEFIATNRDSTYPDSGGRTLPGGGAIVASIETCSAVVPLTVGKPEPYTLELILRLTNCKPENCVVVGDRLDTDIAIGKRVGTRTALVLTGVSTRTDVENTPASARPDQLIENLSELK